MTLASFHINLISLEESTLLLQRTGILINRNNIAFIFCQLLFKVIAPKSHVQLILFGYIKHVGLKLESLWNHGKRKERGGCR